MNDHIYPEAIEAHMRELKRLADHFEFTASKLTSLAEALKVVGLSSLEVQLRGCAMDLVFRTQQLREEIQ
jgi:hypothetical protein